MDENKNTPNTGKDDFDDVLEIMKKRRTKAEYSVSQKRDTEKLSETPSGKASDISKSKTSLSSEENTVLKGYLSETVVVPVTPSKESTKKAETTNQKGSVNIKNNKSDNPVHKDSHIKTGKPKTTDEASKNHNTSGDATVIDIPVVNNKGNKPGDSHNSETTIHNALHLSNANKTNDINTSPAENKALPDATRINMPSVKPVNNVIANKTPSTSSNNKRVSSGDVVSLDDFNSTSDTTHKKPSDEKIKVTFLGSVWFGIIKIVLYLCFVLVVSSALAASVIFVANDIFAFVKDSEISANIPLDANSTEIAAILNKSGVIYEYGDTTLEVTVLKNNSQKLKDTMNTKKVLQPLKDADITDIKVTSNTKFTITLPKNVDVSVVAALLDTVNATKVKTDKQVVVDIPVGATSKDVGKILKEAGVIEYAGVFKMYAEYRISKRSYLTGEFTPGEHIVNPMMNYDKLLDTLSEYDRGVSGTVRITIPEGLTVNETIDLLVKKGVGKQEDYLKALQEFDYDYRFAKELTTDRISEHRFNTDISYRLEGYLFPDTYDFYINENPISAIDKFLSNFNRKFEDEYYERAKELGLTVDEVITLASMIEKEGNNPADYYYISSVFHNRLKSSEHPFLNSDATIQYALSQRTGLYNVDTNLDHPYNTYKNIGLPPGSICNPGIQAIDAALYPKSTNYYYFYTKRNGETVFSRTYDQHQRVVNADKANG